MTNEDKEETEVLYAFFTFDFNSQTSNPCRTLPPDLEVRKGEQNNPSPPSTVQMEKF